MPHWVHLSRVGGGRLRSTVDRADRGGRGWFRRRDNGISLRESTVDRRTVRRGMAVAPVAEVLAGSTPKRRVRLDVNYVPSRNWWFSWSDWDRRSLAGDLAD